jgi:hypothetical protein
VLYLTNRRIIYVPDKATESFQSFAGPILNLHDSHVTAPFFGPNVWQALLQPVQGGGIPIPAGGAVDLKLTFKDGGAFDFHTHYERVRERLQQAVSVSRIEGDGSGSSRAAMIGVDVGNVNLDELPAYQESSNGPLIAPTSSSMPAQQPSQLLQPARDSGVGSDDGRPAPKSTNSAFSPPDEPPPGYEEAQMAGLADEAERRRT